MCLGLDMLKCPIVLTALPQACSFFCTSHEETCKLCRGSQEASESGSSRIQAKLRRKELDHYVC